MDTWWVVIGTVILNVLLVLYFVAIFSNIPFIAKCRRLYIETAMSTTSHQWLATAFIPKSVIEQVMKEREYELALQRMMDSDWSDGRENIKHIEDAKDFYGLYWELETDYIKDYLNRHDEVLDSGYDSILIEDMKGEGYQGRLAVVKNPAQILLDKSDALGSYGQLIDKFGEKNDAVIAVNLDGGSSSVMWYKDRQITKSSSPSGFGRYLPDAIVVKKALAVKKDEIDS